jgi:putative ABC transport system permease protein
MLLEGARLGMTGLVMGVGGAWLTSRLLRSRIWGVGTDDPLTWAGAIVLVLLATLAASWLPACRAAHTDPVEALRDH